MGAAADGVIPIAADAKKLTNPEQTSSEAPAGRRIVEAP